MLAEFIILNREVLLEKSRERVAARATPMPTDVELASGIYAFLDHLGDALGRARAVVRIPAIVITQIGPS